MRSTSVFAAHTSTFWGRPEVGALARLGFFMTLDKFRFHVQDQVAKSLERVKESFVTVTLEADAEPVVSGYEEVRSAFDGLLLP